MKPDRHTYPLALALTLGMVANIAAIAWTRPAVPREREEKLVEIRTISQMGRADFPALWPTWRRSTNVEDCRLERNPAFRPCRALR